MAITRGGAIAPGFTLIELMVTISVFAILAMLALPSFEAVRQRAALRGAGDQLLSFWNQARFEAAKRNQLVKVGVKQSSSQVFCIGAATTTDPADTTPCDCLTANACDVAQFPADSSEWKLVRLSGVTLGTSTWPSASHPAVIEPKRTALTDGNAAGTITLDGPPGGRAYKLRLNVDQFGRGVLCEPTSAVDKLSDYGNQRCSP